MEFNFKFIDIFARHHYGHGIAVNGAKRRAKFIPPLKQGAFFSICVI